MPKTKRKSSQLVADVQNVINSHIQDKEENRHGFVRRVVSLIKGRLVVSECELSRAMNVYAPDPKKGACAVQNWCGAKRERPGKQPYAILELILFGAIKLQRDPGKKAIKLTTTPCESCGTPTVRRGGFEVCPIENTKHGIDWSFLTLDSNRIQAEMQSAAGIAQAWDEPGKPIFAALTLIKCHPSGVELWHPQADVVALWTEEHIEQLRDVIAESMKVLDKDDNEKTVRPEVVIKQSSLAAFEGNIPVI